MAPVRVISADVDEPLPSLERTRAGTDYRTALVFLYRGARVVDHAVLDLTAGAGAPASDLLAARIDTYRADAYRTDAYRSDAHRTDTDRAVGGPAIASAEKLPRVSVVVPTTMTRWDGLARCLRSLSVQSHPDFEVVVVDNRPDGSRARAETHRSLCDIDERIRVVDEPVPGISAARNRGVAHASAGIVAFTDDDVEVARDWLRSIATRFAAEPHTDCVTGLVLPAELESAEQVWFERSGGKIDQQYDVIAYRRDTRFTVTPLHEDGHRGERVPVYRAKFGMGANMAFRVEALGALGGFDIALGAGTRTRGGEDVAAISRLLYSGRTLTFDPASVVHHYHRSDYASLRTQMYGYGVGYTAALTALVLRNPRHLIGLVTMAAGAVRVLGSRSKQRGADDFPSDLSRVEMRGLAAGPFAYARARLGRVGRVWRRDRTVLGDDSETREMATRSVASQPSRTAPTRR